ncbi:hypothetical protein BJV77DRAFT_768887 [Russula vinacea]|nr:hypothetical protein BJV77DRAFT_768887 [Russula vinacea]
MNRTLSSNLITEAVKQHRITICTKVVKSTSLLETSWILRRVLLGDWYQFLGCSEFGLFVQKWNISDRVMYFYAKCVAALTVSLAQRDDRWFQLASRLFNTSRSLLKTYIANGDNIRLAGVIFVVRQTIQSYSGSAWRHREDILDVSSRTLETVCRLDIGGALPELQHQFCGLWNKVVDTAQNDQNPHRRRVSTMTLKNIRNLYIALHHLHENSDTLLKALYTTTNDWDPVLDNPRLYPLCTIDDHHSSSVLDLEFDEPDPHAAEDSLSAGHVPMPAPSAAPPLHSPSPCPQSHPLHRSRLCPPLRLCHLPRLCPPLRLCPLPRPCPPLYLCPLPRLCLPLRSCPPRLRSCPPPLHLFPPHCLRPPPLRLCPPHCLHPPLRLCPPFRLCLHPSQQSRHCPAPAF